MNTMPFSIWAIADLHLSFGVQGKSMEVFGPEWTDWTDRIKAHWLDLIRPQDLVLIPGDISWAMSLENALPDLEWIAQLPGTKVMIRGNHDYWWESKSKIEKILPPSIHIIQNNALTFQGVSIGGARLWDSAEYNFNDYIVFKDNPKKNVLTETPSDPEKEEKIFLRDLGRLELSLQQLDPRADKRIAMTHYPPIGADLKDSRTSRILEKYRIDLCVFGHLHNVRPHSLPFGIKNGTQYILASCDYRQFCPIRLT